MELEKYVASPIQPATQTTAVEQARAVAEVAAAVQVAQLVPRDMDRAWAEMEAACRRIGLAERAFYAVGNRKGPSVHLARELARIWGNLDYGVHELHRDDVRGVSEVRAYAWDQQTNVRSSRTLQIPHRRMVKDDGGVAQQKPLIDLGDIYLNNQNIGARAVREAIYTVLPADFVARAEDICRETVRRGDGRPLRDRIDTMVGRFRTEFDVTQASIEKRIGRPRGQWTAADLASLTPVYTSIQRGDTTVENEFPDVVTVAELATAPTAPLAVHTSTPPDGEQESWPQVAQPPAAGDGTS